MNSIEISEWMIWKVFKVFGIIMVLWKSADLCIYSPTWLNNNTANILFYIIFLLIFLG